MTALVAPVTGTVTAPVDLAAAADRAAGLAEGARAEATRKAYRADWQHFEGWCRAQGLTALPAAPATVGLYVAAYADRLAVATLTRRLSSIAVAHRLTGHSLDTKHAAIRDVMRGLRREKGTAQRHAEALTVPLIRRVIDTCGSRLIDIRDKALLLVGFAAALRRSELVALTLDDVAVVPEGLRITIRRSKADQDGAGEVLAVGRTGTVTCPVAAYENWIMTARIFDGRVFRAVTRHGHLRDKISTNAIAEIVQRRAALAGLDAQAFAGHSMRAGFATAAATNGVEERVIMRQTRHKSAATVRRYIRDGELFRRNLSMEIGL
ncbi:site-specific integrase [Microvirga makkahensis]|uniref:Tyrosine-type recombinase/integrase n=1 Tax=Microvirga makkahensis TaxID=1128670 RepID=A0A7X3MPQ2_9HYPH|nr:site-specific integrase [Microvirga makkahensis]MXQ10944.1 tyrosine-type recombinase/integrase [Microvirga makkahensis]